jgi:hypothetical protein
VSAAPAQADPAVLGSIEPRLWTPPLRDLGTAEHPDYDATYGWDVVDFARDVLGEPLDPWQEWVVTHAGELYPDGRPRFRIVLVLVSRQQGKTRLCQVLSLYWLFVERQKTVLGTSTSREYAQEAWAGAVELAEECEDLADEIAEVRKANGQETLTTTDGCRYKIAASNRRGGRSLTINRLILDELREHASWDAWNASVNATNAVPDAQIYALSNQGDDSSIVLDALRGPAVAHIERGDGDERLGLFEYSAPDGSSPDDLEALAHSCPQLGRRTDPDSIIGAARRAMAAGGEELAGFRTEIMCQRVHLMDPAIDPDHWTRCGTDEPVDLAQHRAQVALCVDVALDSSHVTLVAAAVIGGRVHTEVVQAWEGYGCLKAVRAELPGIVAQVKPRAFGWFPGGPAAALTAELETRKDRRGWPPRGTAVADIKGDQAAVCMGLAEQVAAHELAHPRDPMLTAHINAAQKLRRGDAYVYARRGTAPIDGAYALAGAVHLARTLPSAPAPLAAL